MRRAPLTTVGVVEDAVDGPQSAASDVLRTIGSVDLTMVWLGAAMVVPWFGWRILDDYLARRKTTAIVMRHFALRFVDEFERPLVRTAWRSVPCDRGSATSARRGRFDILLAPGTGRRYPNLSDHRQNVEYDVARVMQVLADDSFVRGPLYTHAGWVVVPFQFKAGHKAIRCHMHILLVSAGGGGGNILRSVKATFRRDLAVTQKTDPRYAERLRRAVTTRFLDTNEFALSDLPKEERFLIGARTTGRLGARHDPEVARHALDESRSEVEALFSRYSIIILIGTGGKGTGSGTMFPLAQIARRAEEARDPDLRPAVVRAARSGQAALRPRGARDRAIRRSGHPADRDPERPRIRGTRSPAAAGRLGTNECSDRARSPWPDLRVVGSLAGRSVRSLDPVCRPRPSANRLRGDRSSGWRRAER